MIESKRSYLSRLMATITLIVFLVTLTGCREVNTAGGELPEWVDIWVQDNQELFWAYENGYFFEEPIVEEKDGLRMTVWAVFSDDLLAHVLVSVESLEELYPVPGYVNITAIDGESIEYSYSEFGATMKDGEVALLTTPVSTIGDHSLTLEMINRDSDPTRVIIEKQIEFNNEELASYNEIYKIDKSVEANSGSLLISRAIYTPTTIYVELSHQGAKRVYDGTEDMDIHLLADELNLEASSRTAIKQGEPYLISFPRPETANDVQLVIPTLSYTVDADLLLSKSDIGQTKYIAGTNLTLKDWRVSDYGLELGVLFSNSGNLHEITEWTLPEEGIASKEFRVYDFNENDEDDRLLTYQFYNEWNSEKWEFADTVNISEISVYQVGGWAIQFPSIKE